jgi:hypothetical protein
MGFYMGGTRPRPGVEKFVAWIANKPADFDAPTR